jgi:hypothetical protein
MDAIALFEGKLRHASDITSITRALETVDHQDLALRCFAAALFMHEDLSLRIGPVQPFPDRILPRIEAAPGEIRENREDVWISYKWMKRKQLPL